MMPMTAPNHCSLSWLLEKENLNVDIPDIAVNGLSMDSRYIQPGDVFIACAGLQNHGLEFATQAATSGAIAVLAEITSEYLPETIRLLEKQLTIPLIPVSDLTERVSFIAGRYYQYPDRKLSVVGITGTNGKTSCSHFIARAFNGQQKVGVMGTLGNGYADDLQPSTHTTMDPVSVQAQLALFVQQQASMVAMEVSSHALLQNRVASIRFDMAVLTNLSRDHLDYHGSMADYARAKSLLFKMPGLKTAIINADDKLGQKLINELSVSSVNVVAFGRDFAKSNYSQYLRAEKVQALATGLRVTLDSSWGQGEVELPVLGEFNVYNAMVALAVMLNKGMAFSVALERLQNITPVRGRMQLINQQHAPQVVIDFAHTPDALEQALSTLREHVQGNLICVFGCGGNRDKGKRPLMGGIAEALADHVIITDDNPRHESSADIINDILAGVKNQDNVIVEADRAKAIRQAVLMASEKDMVLIAGKGHESYQMQGDLKLPFSDESVARQCLGAA